MRSSDPRFAARPAVRMQRARLMEDEIERVRRERREPRVTQWDFLHLSGLRRGILSSFGRCASASGPVLDVFCGTQPYRELIPWRPVWGVDLDHHFGRAHVLGSIPLPIRDGAIGVVFCSQALHLVDDPVATVSEMRRVLRPGGYVIVTIPHLFLAEGPFERHWSTRDVRDLFSGWVDVRIAGIDGPGAAFAFVVGRLAMLAARRFRAVDTVFVASVVAMNGVARVLDVLSKPVHRRWPHSLVLVARRPA